MAINKAWHKEHRMPKHATAHQRIKCHVAHEKHCACRAIPSKLLAQAKKA